MEKRVNNFVIDVATANGSGSQSSNGFIIKSLFRMGIPVGGKNMFPSNIQGLPTWFRIRVNQDGYVGFKKKIDIQIAMNPESIADDIQAVREGGIFIFNGSMKFEREWLRDDAVNVEVPFKKLVSTATKSPKLKKLLTNVVYVGVIGQLLGMDRKVIEGVIRDQFPGKEGVVESNINALHLGWDYAEKEIDVEFPYQVQAMDQNQGKVLMDGNTATGLGMAFGGCTFAAWYPITPSSSVVENFIKYAEKYRKDSDGKNTFAIIQAEDELSSIGMVTGAGWAGARAVTATSGPGLSLMAEFAGMNFYSEIPAVIWNVQRVGPSTGLPTRTMQCDVKSALNLSHGDTRHVVLLPANNNECFEMAKTCFDLAEELQTLVIVLSDLDIGMNQSICDELKPFNEKMKRGKVLGAKDLDKIEDFGRYKDIDGDGIPYRTLPGTHHDSAAYFTRGTGHDEYGKYSEKPEVFKRVLDRVHQKWESAKKMVPTPALEGENEKLGLIAFGSTDFIMDEVRDELRALGMGTDYLRIKALPLTHQVEDFIERHEKVVIIEQNREGQMHDIIRSEYPQYWQKLKSVTHYDGMPIDAAGVIQRVREV